MLFIYSDQKKEKNENHYEKSPSPDIDIYNMK